MSTGCCGDIRVPMRLLWDAANERPDGLSGEDVAELLHSRWSGDKAGHALRLALRRGHLIAVWRTHGTDQGQDDHYRYFSRKGARP